MNLSLASIVGIGVGVVVGALGAGGGILSIPFLVFLLGQNAHDAAAASLVIVLFSSLISLGLRRRQVQWSQGFVFAVISMVGAVLGARLNVRVPASFLMYSFCTLLIAISVMMFAKALRSHKHPTDATATIDPTNGNVAQSRPLWVAAIAAIITGVLTGFFGIGGGIVVVPILVFTLGFTMPAATATSLLIMVITAIAGIGARLGTSVHIDTALILCFALGSMLGSAVGSKVTRNMKDSTLTLSFAVLLALVAVATMLLTALGY
ncbi:sulfite exporter TauE/SafE family protein [Arcanobacterium ihumii]|uniref:sulfite exporter TauE/SafE family protein n=1 Tax=Arcanobacterium ihumii TaxID=2138162 RepID=UPI000F54374F|nr:sulfite exporter TauE/SafE family protein [Arcanobacterium ihumii]